MKKKRIELINTLMKFIRQHDKMDCSPACLAMMLLFQFFS
jgi:hypothetical protein